MPGISIVIPTMNEEKTIGICIEKALTVFKGYGVEGEIIVVDNSTDRTAEIARSMGAVVINSVKGYGNAYLAGFSHAKGDYIAMADGDNTYDFLDFPRFLEPLMNDEADFVIGNRLKNIEKGAMPVLHQYIGNPLLTKVLNFSFKTHISDSHCGMRAFTRKALDTMKLKTGGMEFASEMVIEAADRGLRIQEIPINYYTREAPSKLRSFEDGWRHLRFIMLYKPIPFLFIPGLFVFLLGFFLTVLILTTGEDVVTTRLHSFILASFLLIIGSNIISTGVYLKAYSAVHGISGKDDIFVKRLLNYHSLEKEIITGTVLLGIGMFFGIKVILTWMHSGYGSLSEIETAIMAMDFAAIGILMISMSILLSVLMLDLKNNP
ncbi:MAG: glycosyltransferase family 2 protein [ANME-2 cluster archaeon]|nr:glycosyltransferase family 2 protein [ANME-2 cluster archaeon]